MLLVMVWLFLVPGCGIPFETPPSVSSPITIELAMSKAPRLNEPARITCTIKSAFPAPNSVAQVELPSGATLIDGNLSWQGDLEPGSPVRLSGTIKFVEEGQWTIKAFAKYIISEQTCWGDGEYIYVTVTKYTGKFGWDMQPVSPAEQTDQPYPGERPQYIPDPKGEGAVPPPGECQ